MGREIIYCSYDKNFECTDCGKCHDDETLIDDVDINNSISVLKVKEN